MKLSKQNKLKFMALLILLSTFSFSYTIQPARAVPPAWLKPWLYRKTHVINQTVGGRADYSVLIKVNYTSGIDGNETINCIPAGVVHLNSRCQIDFDDVRFTEDDAVTVLGYWLEEKVDSSYALFWVEITDDISVSDVTIYIYYGNEDATSLSDGDDAFYLFDGFDSGPLGGLWDSRIQAGGSINFSSGCISIECPSDMGWVTWIATFNTYGVIGFAMEAYVRSNITTASSRNWVGTIEKTSSFQDDEKCFGYRSDDDETYFKYHSSDDDINQHEILDYTLLNDTLWHRTSTKQNGGAAGPQLAIDDTQVTGTYSDDHNHKMLCYVQNTGAGKGVLYVDWVAYRYYANPEPVQSTWGAEEAAPVINIDVIITDMEGCGNWVFAEEKYYTFQATVNSTTLDTVIIAFSDGAHWINASYNHIDEEWTLLAGKDYVMLKAGTVTSSGPQYDITFLIYFKNAVLDCLDVNLYLYSNSTTEYECDWSTAQSSYFNIYNLGGFATLETSGNAGRRDGGGVFELYAQNMSWAQANVTFRKLQHYHTYFHIWVEDQRTWDDYETDTIEIRMGLDYCTDDDDWITGWNIYLEQIEGWLDSGTMRLVWNVTWYYQDTKIVTTTMNSFPDANETGDAGIPALTCMILDLWFNKVNASSTVGGRITSEYFAMRDTSDWFSNLWTGANWSPDLGNVTQQMFFDDLLSESSDIISSKQVKMMRVWTNLTQSANTYDIRVELRDFDLESFEIASDLMQGINTPIFVATITPNMPQGGFFNALSLAISGFFAEINGILGPGLLNFWLTFVGAIDTIFEYFGMPNAFSMFLGWVTSLWSWIGPSFGYVIDALTGFFTFTLTFISKLLSALSTGFGVWASMFTQFFMILDTGWGMAESLWDTLALGTWVTIFFIMYPLYLLFVWDEQGIDRVLGHIKMVIDIAAFFFGIFIWVIQLTLNVLGRIIESIPVVE